MAGGHRFLSFEQLQKNTVSNKYHPYRDMLIKVDMADPNGVFQTLMPGGFKLFY